MKRYNYENEYFSSSAVFSFISSSPLCKMCSQRKKHRGGYFVISLFRFVAVVPYSPKKNIMQFEWRKNEYTYYKKFKSSRQVKNSQFFIRTRASTILFLKRMLSAVEKQNFITLQSCKKKAAEFIHTF